MCLLTCLLKLQEMNKHTKAMLKILFKSYPHPNHVPIGVVFNICQDISSASDILKVGFVTRDLPRMK